ncbi:MAG: cytochrome c biogenesis protein CcsA [Candidatus Thermoplasmatota archaeon]|nr:cytochrome c biogenesis protein CcsA [Candidatus Thermoplasmatota archaeon]
MKYKWEMRETVGLFGFLLVLATLYFGLMYLGPAKFFTAPNAQKLFYLHVPSGLVTYLAFLMVVGGSAFYLYNQSDYADRLSKCSAELGIVFGFMSLASGTFWMKAEWGGDIFSRFLTDMRLATTLAMWILYIAYFVYRRQPETFEVKKNAAVLGLSGMIMVPLSYLSSRFLRSHHPVIVGTENQDSLDPSLRMGLYTGLFAFLFIYIFLFSMRIKIEEMERSMLNARMEKI